ncbi:NADH:ubiquinone reductase (Na(+)-transporting) subunit B [uncultured Rikenella sp.]|uniref:NADH:ubiquinone reductase (Na(+)-transporting) subunit B n=1 Tax=uncultured Rikenella sp. TaxID=368003 RepID=UPI0026094141|nr:NADH:ubiquinone reductase (Na(+)-transporting) subunit B [uncultured Rikenella sp.]
MKGLRHYLNKIKPNFEQGGKYGRFASTFEAFESFLYVPNTVTRKGAHIRDAMDLKRTMTVVIIALLPALLFGMFNIGYQHNLALGLTLSDVSVWSNFWFGFLKVLPIIVVAYAVGLGIEFLFAELRHEEVNEGFLVSGMLIPMIMPVDCPLWIVAVATAFAVVVGKEMFGGTGMNIFNPALLARAFIFFAYPTAISGNEVWVAGLKNASASGMQLVDGYSGATPLSDAAAALSNGAQSIDWSMGTTPIDWFYGLIPGSIGETSTLAILIGAFILIWTGVGSWRIMLSTVIGGLVMGGIFNLIGTNVMMDIPAWYHLLIGGFAFGTVFMATDPVTAAQTDRGKWIYGFLIGVLCVLTRVLNPGYPEGMMLAILFMNAMAPLIDYYVVQGNIKRRLKRAKVNA